MVNKGVKSLKLNAMKSRFSVVLLLAIFFVGVESASAQVRKWEVEIGAGCIVPSNNLKPIFDKSSAGWNVLVEARHNFGMLPLDVGLHINGTGFERGHDLGEIKSIKDVKFHSFNALAVADFNLLRNKKVQVFVGCGLGYGWLASQIYDLGSSDDALDAANKVQDTWKERSALVVMPRVGIEAWHHLRATVYYKAPADKTLIKEQGHFGVSLGFVIGGGLKNKASNAN